MCHRTARILRLRRIRRILAGAGMCLLCSLDMIFLAGRSMAAEGAMIMAQVRQLPSEEEKERARRGFPPESQTATVSFERIRLSGRVGYHLFPSNNYIDGLKNKTAFPVAEDNLDALSVAFEADYFILPFFTLGGEIAYYGGSLDYRDGSQFTDDVLPLLFNVKYWAREGERIMVYVGGGTGIFLVRRELSIAGSSTLRQREIQIGGQLIVGVSVKVARRMEVALDDRYAIVKGSSSNLLGEVLQRPEVENTDEGGNIVSLALVLRF